MVRLFTFVGVIVLSEKGIDVQRYRLAKCSRCKKRASEHGTERGRGSTQHHTFVLDPTEKSDAEQFSRSSIRQPSKEMMATIWKLARAA